MTTQTLTPLMAAFRSLLADAVEARGGIEPGALARYGEVHFHGTVIEVTLHGERFLVIDRATLEARARQLARSSPVH